MSLSKISDPNVEIPYICFKFDRFWVESNLLKECLLYSIEMSIEALAVKIFHYALSWAFGHVENGSAHGNMAILLFRITMFRG